MIKIFRYSVAFLIVGPFILFVQFARLFIGKQKAVQLCTPAVIGIAKFFLKLVVPRITRPEDFDMFRLKFKNNFWIWRPLFDFDVKEENDNLLKLNVWNCPFCELFRIVGLQEMNRHVCQGDWELAKENKGIWEFERQHEIGKGDGFCDHTYKRII